MKSAFVSLLALAMAAPALTIPATAEAQVMVGSGARRNPPARHTAPPSLSPREERRLDAAYETVSEMDGLIADLHEAAPQGLSAEQQAQLQSHTRRRDEAQRTIDRLEEKLNR